MTKELKPHVVSLRIDSEREMAVARAVKQGGKARLSNDLKKFVLENFGLQKLWTW